MASEPNPKGISLHIPVLIFLQICFIILFGAFTRQNILFLVTKTLFITFRYDYQTAFKNQNEGEYGVGVDNSHNMTLKIYTSKFPESFLILSKKSLSISSRFPRCPCHDFCWFWFLDDIFEKIWLIRRVSELYDSRTLYSVAYSCVWIPTFAL